MGRVLFPIVAPCKVRGDIIYCRQLQLYIIHGSPHTGVKRPKIIKSCKANGILNIALSERWSETETDRTERKIYDKVSEYTGKKAQNHLFRHYSHLTKVAALSCGAELDQRLEKGELEA